MVGLHTPHIHLNGFNVLAATRSYKPTIQPSVGAQVTDSFAAGLFAYNKPRGRAYYFSGTNAVGARKLDPFTVPGYISERKNDQVTFNTNLLTFNVVDSKWYVKRRRLHQLVHMLTV
jgi:hypothetical protein